MASGSASCAWRKASAMKPGTEPAREHRRAQAAAVGHGLVDHVPDADVVLVVADDAADVLAHRRLELARAQLAHPAWQLEVPHQRVAANLLPRLARALDDRVGGAELELALLGLHGLPLHLVLRRHGRELRRDRLAVGAVLLGLVAAHRRADLQSLRLGQHAQRLAGQRLGVSPSADEPDRAQDGDREDDAKRRRRGGVPTQKAPRRVRTAGTVLTRMLRSRKTDQRSR